MSLLLLRLVDCFAFVNIYLFDGNQEREEFGDGFVEGEGVDAPIEVGRDAGCEDALVAQVYIDN